MANDTMIKNNDKPAQIEYWARVPIIVNGITAYNFFHTYLAKEQIANKR